MDVECVRANGPWVLVKPEEPKKQTDSGLYVPDGNLYERLGYLVGRVVSVGKGYYEEVNGKTKFIEPGVSPGDRVVFRGHLKEANKFGASGHCFMHMKDLIGVLDEEVDLDLALPYDN